MENIWAWTADHDLDTKSQDQLDVFAARGILIESQGPTWLYGTSSEHNVLYQYQLSGAKDIVLGMVQTESPYFQPTPPAPRPFSLGQFANDPDFSNCRASEKLCASSWAVRIVDSESIYMLGAGEFPLELLESGTASLMPCRDVQLVQLVLTGVCRNK
jgi:hypothetical protein